MKPLPFARSAKAARKTRLNLMPDWAEVKLEKRALLAVVTWDGGAGTMNWGDANNWSANALPTSTDDVVIPDLAGVQTINVNITTGNAKTLNSVENVTIQASRSLTLRDGTSQVSGVFIVSPGGTLVAESGSVFTPTGTVTIDGANLYAKNSGKLMLAVATSYVNSTNSAAVIQASGTNSLIDLSGLTKIDNGGLSGGTSLDVNVTTGGSIDLRGVTQITVSTSAWTRVQLKSIDATSVINLQKLTDFQDNQAGSESYSLYSAMTASTNGQILTTALKNLTGVRITHDGGTIDVSKVEQLFNSGIYVNAGTINYSSLFSIKDSEVSISDGTIGLSAVYNIDGSGFYASNGKTINLGQITSYKNTSKANVYFQANGAGSQVILSGLLDITVGGAGGSSAARLDVNVTSGGSIDLRSVTQIYAGANWYQYIRFNAKDTNSVILLQKLTDFQDYESIDDYYHPYSAMTASTNGQILTTSLKNLTGVRITHDGGTIDVSKVEQLFNSGIYVNAGTINYSSLFSIKDSEVSISDGTIGLSAVYNIDGTSLYVSNGRQIDLSQITSFVTSVKTVAFQSRGLNSKILLPGVVTIINKSDRGCVTINAIESGVINLANVSSIFCNTGFEPKVQISVSDNNSLIDLKSLVSLWAVGRGISDIKIENSGKILLPATGFQMRENTSMALKQTTLNASVTLLQGARLFGGDEARIIGNVINVSGTVEPGFSDNSVAKFTIQGDFTQNSGGTTVIDIFGTGVGTGHDQLAITGTSKMGGRLIIDRQNVAPVLDSTYRVVSFASLGSETWITSLPSAANNVLLTKTTNTNDITIKAIPAPPVFVDDAYAAEGDASSAGGPVLNMAFNIRGVAPFGGITVNYATSGGNPGVDFTPVIGSFTITQAGAYSQVINVPILGNQRIQEDRLFNLQATAEGLTPYSGQGLIYDDDAPVTMTLAADYATANTNTAFSPSPSATIMNKNNHLVEGATVQFSVFAAGDGQTATFAGGASSAVVMSNASGVASAPTLTANNLLGGPYSLAFRAVNPDGTTAANGLMALRNVGAPTVLVVSGGAQLAPATTAFAQPFKVKVVNAAGAGIAGVTVTFTPPASGASGSFAGGVDTAVTDIYGVATSASFTANSTTGTYLVTASAPGYASATLQATNQNALKPLVVVQGGGQSATVNTAFAQTIKIQAVDLNNNPVPGVQVTFAVPSSGASGSFAGGVVAAITDSSGIATSPVLTANTIAGAFSVTASVSGSLPVSINLTNSPGAAATVTAVSGGGQAARVEQAFVNPLKAKVVDTYGNVVPGVSVVFAVPGSGASLRYAGGSNSAVTGADGVATTAAPTANSVAGSYVVTASTAGAVSATYSMANSSATAASLAIVSGSGQTATVASGFGQALIVKATDSFGNAVGGVTVTFAAPGGSGASAAFAGGVLSAVTGLDGVATSAGVSANTVDGSYVVTASVPGLGTLNFNLTNTAGAAASMNVVSGSGQSAKLGVAFANPLIVSVVDTYGNAVAGTTVTFALPGSGASATFAGGMNTAVSGADGLAASVALSANNVAGSYVVTASAPGLSDKSFALNNTVFTVTGLEVVDGSSFRVRFNDTIATSGLQINDVYTGNVVTEEADLVVKDSAGAVVRGSMIVAADLKSLLFVKSGAAFSAGSFSVKLRSGSNAFRASDGTLLDGDGDGSPSGDYLTSFSAVATERTVSIPDVVRGPGQDLRVNPTDNGVPVKLSDGQDIFSIEMSLDYDPQLLTVTELVVPDALAANFNITYNVTTPGHIDIVGVAPAGLPSGSQTLFYVRGNVPTAALYRTKCQVGISNLQLYRLDGTKFTKTVDSALMLNEFPGDVTGDGRYNSLDALRIQRYLVNLDRSFTQYPLVDPVIVADITGDGRVNSLDSLYLQRYLVNITVPYITAPPVATVTQTTGLDPIIRIPQNLSAARGKTIIAPVELYNSDSSPIEISSYELALAIDTKLFDVKSIRAIGQSSSRYVKKDGSLAIFGLTNAIRLAPGETITVAWIEMKVKSRTNAVDAAINLLDEVSIGRNRFVTSLNSNDLVLSPAPTRNANDAVDGKVKILVEPKPSVHQAPLAALMQSRKSRFSSKSIFRHV